MWFFRRAWNELADLYVKRDSLYEKFMIQKPLWNQLISYLEVPLYMNYAHQFGYACIYDLHRRRSTAEWGEGDRPQPQGLLQGSHVLDASRTRT